VRSYFVEGILPEAGTVCDIKIPQFSNSTGWAEVLEQLNEEA
jgi:hypothetical protein